MAFCGKCGTKVEDNVKFCPGCGTQISAPTAQQTQSQQYQTVQSTQSNKTDISAKITSFNDTADTTMNFDKADIEQNRTMAILAYLGPIVLIPIFAAKGSKFARYHSNQGLILLLTAILFSIAYTIVNAIILAISWRLYFISTIISLLSIVFFILAVIGIINAVNGRAKELPIIGKYKILK